MKYSVTFIINKFKNIRKKDMPVTQMNMQQRRMQPILKKMNAEEENLSVNARLDLVIADKTVEKMMGPEPIPSLDIQMDEI